MDASDGGEGGARPYRGVFISPRRTVVSVAAANGACLAAFRQSGLEDSRNYGACVAAFTGTHNAGRHVCGWSECAIPVRLRSTRPAIGRSAIVGDWRTDCLYPNAGNYGAVRGEANHHAGHASKVQRYRVRGNAPAKLDASGDCATGSRHFRRVVPFTTGSVASRRHMVREGVVRAT